MSSASSIAHKCWSALSESPFSNLPVVILKGPARGKLWTLAPCSGYWRGVVESDVEDAIVECGLSPGSVAWDLGAHFGYFSFVMQAYTGSEGAVYGFEPDPNSFAKFQRHVRFNRAKNIRVFPYAVGDEETLSPLIQEEGGSTVSHLPYVGEEVPQDAIQVQTVMLDRLVREGTVQVPQFIKVDVEGHGGKALKGAKETLAESKPAILMSFHSPREIEATQEVLSPLGYVAYRDGKRIENPMEWTTVLLRAF